MSTGPVLWLIDGVECEIIDWQWMQDRLVMVPTGADREDEDQWIYVEASTLREAGRNMRTFVITPKEAP